MDILRRKKRLCIYVAYDKEGIIDSYIGYMLKELKTCMDCLVVIYNGEQVIKGKGILEKYADRLFSVKTLVWMQAPLKIHYATSLVGI